MLGFNPVCAVPLAAISLDPFIIVSLSGQTIATTLNAVEVQAKGTVVLTGQSPLIFTQRSVSPAADANAELLGQSMHFTLNSMRMWKKIDPSQNANWTAISTTQSAGWTPIDTTQSPGWTDIET